MKKLVKVLDEGLEPAIRFIVNGHVMHAAYYKGSNTLEVLAIDDNIEEYLEEKKIP